MEAVSTGDCMEMTLFWILAGVIALGVGVILVQALLRGGREAAPAAAYDMQVYRDQLREIERDVARGTMRPEEADRLKAEVSRRLLEADRALKAAGSDARAPGSARIAAAGAMLVLLGGSFATYLDLARRVIRTCRCRPGWRRPKRPIATVRARPTPRRGWPERPAPPPPHRTPSFSS